MLQNFEVIIGIENHVELKTHSKMFAAAPVHFGAQPNTMVSPVDLGYPGALPMLNKEGVRLAILTVNALHMEVDSLLKFDRKNYFYPDLAKGFQITQQFHPIGKNGYLDIQLPNQESKRISIERLHIEEDTAKQTHKNDFTYLDYNRSGVGLIEIVSNPVIRSADEAVAYVAKLREILLFLNVSDVKMNEGSLRCDVNISLRPHGATTYSHKVEIKNLNSLANVKKAIEFEIARQSEILLRNELVVQETRRFDEQLQQTVSMRAKTDAVDYCYFPEPNLAPIQLDATWINTILTNAPELADQKRRRYVDTYQLKLEETDIILTSLEMTRFFESTLQVTKDANKVANYLIGEIQFELNKTSKTIDQIALTPELLGEMINLLNQGIISSKQAKKILPIIFNSAAESVTEIIERLDLKLISDPKKINELLTLILNENNDLIIQNQRRPERIIKTVMGDLMKKTQGNINPDLAMELLVKMIGDQINGK